MRQKYTKTLYQPKKSLAPGTIRSVKFELNNCI